MKKAAYWLLIAFLLLPLKGSLFADDFYLDSPNNKGTWRFEVNNDAIWDNDSNFSNGWSLQYHSSPVEARMYMVLNVAAITWNMVIGPYGENFENKGHAALRKDVGHELQLISVWIAKPTTHRRKA